MSSKIKNPKNPEQEAKFNLGDIVVLKSFAIYSHKIKDKFHFDQTAPINVSPFMIVIRADLNTSNFRTDDFQSQDFIRYRCMWYNPSKGDFQEEVFFESLLMRVKSYNDNLFESSKSLSEEFKYGDAAIFRTRDFEMSKVFPEHNPHGRFKEVANFIPPDLVVSGIKIAKDIDKDGKEKKISLEENGKVHRYDCENRIIGRWFSTTQGKFLKRDFIPHALEAMEIKANFEEG